MDDFEFNFRWRYSESKQSLEYDYRSNAPSILRRFAGYPCNRDLGTCCLIFHGPITGKRLTQNRGKWRP